MEVIIYSVICKNEGNVSVLKTIFKNKPDAIDYAVKKIDTLLQIISDEYKESDTRILPIHSQMIYTMYLMKGVKLDKYEYFIENYKAFYRGIAKKPVMFFISEHLLI